MSTMWVMSVSITSCPRPGVRGSGRCFCKAYGNIGLLFNLTAIVDVDA